MKEAGVKDKHTIYVVKKALSQVIPENNLDFAIALK